MCGIAGFTHRTYKPDPGRINKAISLISHRGPDRQAVFETCLVSLGAARLRILDLASGDQPMLSADGDTAIVFNGEIYNHRELRAELESLGHRFYSNADTETLLRAYLEWDTECFRRLRGMFAVALWTESRKRLVLARDRIGIKPLYLARRGKDLYFGSELKTIFSHPEIDRRIDLNGLDCYLSLNYVPAPWTLLEGIEKLRPGYWLEWVDGEIYSEPYWRLPSAKSSTTPRDWEGELDALLQDSVREHLLSDVPIGLWLSGGLDSSTILDYAAKASPSPLRTFSISFRGRTFDETNYIRPLVSRYGTHHEELDLNTDLPLQDAIEEFAYYSDEPNADAGALPVWFLSKMTRASATVALSGEGADELFGGYLTYRADALARRVRHLPGGVLPVVSHVLGKLPVSDEKISLEYKLKRFVEGCQMPAERAHVWWNGTFSESEKRRLVNAPLPLALQRLLSELRAKGDNTNAYLWFDQKYFLPDDILAKVDRMSMAHSIEVRPPFLDHRIVEFAASLPERLKIHGGQQKVILRRLMKDRLPRAISRRGKVGFDIPAHEWLRGPLRPLLLDALSACGRHGLFSPRFVNRALQDHLSRRVNLGYHLWGLMILSLWMGRWRIQSSVAEPLRQPAQVTALTSI